MARPSSLSSPSEQLVLTALRNQKLPMTAYSLLETLKQSGIKSPPIIYRALNALVESGAVHKIKALSAFIACNCTPDHSHSLSVLTVCHNCDGVEELHDHGIIHHLEHLRKQGVRLLDHAVVELPITCSLCL